jgi:hypothetical protein
VDSDGTMLTAETAQHLRELLVSHGDDVQLGACPHCEVSRCEVWRDAYDRLALAGELMATPDRWEHHPSLRRDDWR